MPLTAPPNSLVKCNNAAGATGDDKHRVLPEGNQKPRNEKNVSELLIKMARGADASAKPKMQNDVSVKEAHQRVVEVNEVKIQVKSSPSHPGISQSVQKETDIRTRPSESTKQVLNSGAKGTTASACVHPLKDPPRHHINTTSAQREAKISACSAQNNPADAKTGEIQFIKKRVCSHIAMHMISYYYI